MPLQSPIEYRWSLCSPGALDGVSQLGDRAMTEVRGEGPDGRSFTAPGHLSHTDTLPRASPRDKEGRRAGALALAPAKKLLGKPTPRWTPSWTPSSPVVLQKREMLGLALLKPPQAKRLQRGWTGNSSSNRRGRPGAKSPPSSRPRPSLHPAPPERRHRTCAQPQVGRKRP